MGRGWSFPSLRDPHLGVFAELSLAEFCKFGWQTPGTETQGRFGPHTGVTSMADLSSPKSPGAHPQLLSPSHLCFSKAPLIFKSLHGLPALPDSAAQSNALTDSKLLKTQEPGAVRDKPLNFFPKGQEMGKKKTTPGAQERHRCCCCGHWAALCSGCKGRHFQGASAVKAVAGFASPCPFPLHAGCPQLSGALPAWPCQAGWWPWLPWQPQVPAGAGD